MFFVVVSDRLEMNPQSHAYFVKVVIYCIFNSCSFKAIQYKAFHDPPYDNDHVQLNLVNRKETYHAN